MRILFLILSFFAGQFSYSQGHKQVKWNAEARVNEGKTEIVLTATIDEGWHIYSQNMNGDGPVPAKVEFSFPDGVKPVGKTIEPEPIKHFDENFGMDVLFFNHKVEFVQSITGKIKPGMIVKGKVNFMICNDEMCLPPTDVNFEIKL